MRSAVRRLLGLGAACAIAACSFTNNLDAIGVGDGVPGSVPQEGGTADAPVEPFADGSSDAKPGVDGGTDAGNDACAATALECSLNAGLAAYWPFDDDFKDKSGNGNDLAVTAGTSQRVAAKFGNGYTGGLGADYLCGTCGALTRASSVGLDLGGDFTISLWANRTANANVDGTWYHYGLFDNGQVVVGAYGNGSTPAPTYPSANFFNGPTAVGSASDNTFDFRAVANVGVWVHLIVFRHGKVGGLRVNGQQTTQILGGAVGNAAATFRVGHDSGGYPWQGILDEVAVWSRALDPTEMDALYNGGAGRKLK